MRFSREKELEKRLERIRMAIDKGITGNIETGEVFGIRGKLINGKDIGGYIYIGFNHNGKTIGLRAHQFIYYLAHGTVVYSIDHINGNRTDNRIGNLRSVTPQENQWNHTKAKGYYWLEKLKKWVAIITVNYKQVHLGHFKEEDDARQAYLDAKEKYHII